MNPAPKPGEVWATRTDVWLPSLSARVPAGDSDIVLVIVGPEGSRHADVPDVRVVPLSTRTDMAADEDVILTPDETGLRRAWMAETWNTRPALVRNLNKCIGRLSDTAFQRVLEVHDSRYTGETSPSAAGTAIESDEDARFQFQTAEAMRVGYLSEPVFDLLAQPTEDPNPSEAGIAGAELAYYLFGEECDRAPEAMVYVHAALHGDKFAAFRNPAESSSLLRLWTVVRDIVRLQPLFESYGQIAGRAVIDMARPATVYTVGPIGRVTVSPSRLSTSASQLT